MCVFDVTHICVAVCCNVLQCVAVCYNETIECVFDVMLTHICVAVSSIVLQCVVVRQ